MYFTATLKKLKCDLYYAAKTYCKDMYFIFVYNSKWLMSLCLLLILNHLHKPPLILFYLIPRYQIIGDSIHVLN